MKLLLLIIAVTLVLIGCDRSQGSSDNAATSASQPATARPQPSATLVPQISAIHEIPIATTDARTPVDVTVEKSPLASWDPSTIDAFFDEGLGPGTLSITEDCVQLVLENGNKVLPVWPEPTTWNVETQTIEYVGPADSERLKLREGDFVSFGGTNIPDVFMLLVRAPDRDCRAQVVTTYVVSDVRVLSKANK